METHGYAHLRVTPERVLGSGGYKTCYSIKGRRDSVVLVHGESIFDLDETFRLIEEEAKHLATLASLGLPVAEIHEIGVLRINGERQAAHIMPRYVCGNRDNCRAQFLRIFNERTLNQARRLLSQFERLQPLYVEDLQFLFRRDGSFVIADPLWVEHRYSTAHRVQLTRIIKAARYSLRVRQGGITHPADSSLWHEAEQWQHEQGVPGK